MVRRPPHQARNTDRFRDLTPLRKRHLRGRKATRPGLREAKQAERGRQHAERPLGTGQLNPPLCERVAGRLVHEISRNDPARSKPAEAFRRGKILCAKSCDSLTKGGHRFRIANRNSRPTPLEQKIRGGHLGAGDARGLEGRPGHLQRIVASEQRACHRDCLQCLEEGLACHLGVER